MNRFSLRRPFKLAALLLIGLLFNATAHADEAAPVSAVLQLLPAVARPGDVVELRLKVTVNAPWHVYGQMPGDGGQQPMNMRLKLPEGVQAVDGWVWPPMAAVLNAGEHVLTQKLRVTALPEAADVKVMLSYQACNDQMCLPMEVVELGVALKPAVAQATGSG